MINNKILALKYRPQEFKDLIGQEVMAETVTTAIKLGKTPNAYFKRVSYYSLFCIGAVMWGPGNKSPGPPQSALKTLFAWDVNAR